MSRLLKLYLEGRSDWIFPICFAEASKHSDISYQLLLEGKISSERMFIYRIQKGAGRAWIHADDASCLEFQRRYEEYQWQIHVPEATEAAAGSAACRRGFTLG